MKAVVSMIAVLTLGLGFATPRPAAAAEAAAGKVYELRIYQCHPGKLDALNARFRDHTCRLFRKHGIELVGFWVPTVGDEAADTLYYIVAFPNAEAQKKSWDEFRADPDWKAAKAASESEGPIVKQIQSKNLKATDYSPLK